MPQNSAQLQEIKDLIGSIASEETAPARSVTDWIGRAQKSCSPRLGHARISLFFAHHGFAAKLKITDSNFDKYVKDNIDGSGRLNRLCQTGNTDLRLYEMDTGTPTRDCLSGDAAMDIEDMVKSIAYGMMAVEPGLDLIAVTAFGHGSEMSAKSLNALHDGTSPDDVTCARILKASSGLKGFEALQHVGGYELAALCGVVIAARLAQIPVLLEGETGAAILAVLKHENPGITDHCAVTGSSPVSTMSGDIPFFAVPHAVPDEPGLAISSLIPVLKSQVILQGS